MEPTNYAIKIALLGDVRTGKTSIRRRYMGMKFQSSHIYTLGADFSSKEIMIGNNNLKLQIWDIAGQEYFDKLRKHYLQNCQGVFLVYDITNQDSFIHTSAWLDEVWQMNEKSIPILLIGNKVDLDDTRVISSEEAEKFVTDLIRNDERVEQIDFIETSALTGVNINKGFEMLAKRIIETF